jgi:hypothetical protein
LSRTAASGLLRSPLLVLANYAREPSSTAGP